MDCLHGTEIGSIDFFALVAVVIGSLFLADALHFSNRSWLRSFRSSWGLGEKLAQGERKKQISTSECNKKVYFPITERRCEMGIGCDG